MKPIWHEEPFHSGEIYSLWQYLYDLKLSDVILQVYMNHTNDEKLKDFIDNLLEHGFHDEHEKIEFILKEIGVRLPPAPPDRPQVDVKDIPAGARINDDEISRLLQNELRQRMTQCSYLIGLLTNESIIELFANFHAHKIDEMKKLTLLIKENGWYIQPPTHIK
ncbi:MAG TPA: DUF3231 family protein [Cerasibacillus sp.]|uniref:DUF3231 family protein n=1 Tax=Cerasibacillus sp. TaxID=2498711 RepID=UPI002F3FD1DB